MFKRYKTGLYLFCALAIGFAQMAKADVVCPSNLIQPFVGQWQGDASFFSADGTAQKSGNLDEFAIIDCQSFEVTVKYQDNNGNTARILHFVASPDESAQLGLFIIRGKITDGSGASGTDMTGSVRIVQKGTLLGTFLGTGAGGKPAYLTELMNVTNGGSQLVRTVQMFDGGRGGPYLGTRVVQDGKIQ